MSLNAQLVRRIAEAADFGHCLECGADIPLSSAIAGAVLCKPCDIEAALHEAALESRHAVELRERILAEPLDQPRHAPAPQWWLDMGLQP